MALIIKFQAKPQPPKPMTVEEIDDLIQSPPPVRERPDKTKSFVRVVRGMEVTLPVVEFSEDEEEE